MGQLVNGVWQTGDLIQRGAGGRLERPDSTLRGWVTSNGSSRHAAAPGRYHLYVAYACPWAHRTLIMRSLKGLDGMIGVSVVHWLMGEQGWTFEPGPGVVPDPVLGARYLHQIYSASDPTYTGKVTTPVLWDKATRSIVSNESADILVMFNRAFDAVGAAPGDYYPADRKAEIDALNERIYDAVNNGVYKAGFASTQEAYEEAATGVFAMLDELEQRLSGQRYLVGDAMTLADIRLFVTLLRFDLVYHGHFKCNRRRIVDYPALWAFTRELYQHPAITPTIHTGHIQRHYYQSHRQINPTGIVPIGPALDLTAPHGRDRLPPGRGPGPGH
jgi:putative glutathione S-transferase